MHSVFEFVDYKKFLKSWIEAQPKQGRGIIKKMSDHLRMSPTMMSHILSGDKHFSMEAANDLGPFLALLEPELDYFLLLVSHAKAGSFSLQQRLLRKIKSEQKKAAEVSKRMKPDAALKEQVKNTFYSNWLYTGIRNMTACPDLQTVDAIAKQLQQPRAVVAKIIDFLLTHNLCIEKKGRLLPGPQHTHVAHDSPLVSRHHQNWRMQGFNKMLIADEKNLFFTAPMSMSEHTADEIRRRIPSMIEEVVNLVKPSPSEIVRCFNIDWFEY